MYANIEWTSENFNFKEFYVQILTVQEIQLFDYSPSRYPRKEGQRYTNVHQSSKFIRLKDNDDTGVIASRLDLVLVPRTLKRTHFNKQNLSLVRM